MRQVLVSRPTDEFVASFTGANLLRGSASRFDDRLTHVELDSGESVFSTDLADGVVGVVVYPWEIAVGRARIDDSALKERLKPLETIGKSSRELAELFPRPSRKGRADRRAPPDTKGADNEDQKPQTVTGEIARHFAALCLSLITTDQDDGRRILDYLVEGNPTSASR